MLKTVMFQEMKWRVSLSAVNDTPEDLQSNTVFKSIYLVCSVEIVNTAASVGIERDNQTLHSHRLFNPINKYHIKCV